ncbi:MAG TPA: hypothetical protein VHR86_04070 [Armatimonadota bacterium]|nr:hypothetical protein [Armatimonadota bacterium]
MKGRILLGIFLAFAGFTGSAGAVGPVDVSAEVSVMSKYLWRGVALNEDPVFQPSIMLGVGGVSFNIWGNMDLSDYQDKKFHLTETDYTLDYTLELPLLSLSAGALRYQFQDLPGYTATTELYIGAESSLPGGPSLKIYQDVDKGEGAYVEAGVSHALPVTPFASLEMSASLGWGSSMHNRFNYGLDGMGGAFTDFTLGAGLPIGLGETISVTPSFLWVSCINSDMRKEFDKNHVVFGLTASAEF